MIQYYKSAQRHTRTHRVIKISLSKYALFACPCCHLADSHVTHDVTSWSLLSMEDTRSDRATRIGYFTYLELQRLLLTVLDNRLA